MSSPAWLLCALDEVGSEVVLFEVGVPGAAVAGLHLERAVQAFQRGARYVDAA